MEGRRAGELRSIQYLRGIAALMVALYHVSHYADVFGGDASLQGWNPLGVYGVSIFFAISGYLMATLVRRTDPWVFLAHRIVRIYPTLLIVVAAYVLVGRAVGREVPFEALALTLVPAGPRIYPLWVEWTLVFEVTFYVALFAVALGGATRWLDALAILWLGVLTAALVWPPAFQGELQPPIHRLPLVEACTGFAAGLLIPTALRTGLVPRWTWLVASGVVALSIALKLGAESRWASGLLSAVLVAGAVRADPGPSQRPSDPLKKLGDWSYALYLCHVPVIVLTYRLAPAGVSTKVLWVVTLTLALATGAAVGMLDVRLYRVLKRVVDRSRALPLRLVVGACVATFTGLAIWGAADVVGKERRTEEARAVIRKLPPEALRDPAAAQAAIDAAGLRAPSLRGEVNEVLLVENGLAVRGWLADADDPARELSVAVFHKGAQLSIARPWRRRPDVAAALGRPELAKAKTGFGFGTPPASCADARDVVVLGIDLEGKAVVLPGQRAIKGCP